MMKKIIAMVTLLAVALIGAEAASAYGYYGTTYPRAPNYDGFARVGGAFPTMSFYMTGLRGGVETVPRQGYGMRNGISSYHYPGESIYPQDQSRYLRYSDRPARVGGRYSYQGLRGVRPNTYGDFVFNGRHTGLSGGIFS